MPLVHSTKILGCDSLHIQVTQGLAKSMKGISGESDNKKFNVVIKLVYKCTLEYHKQKLEKNIDSDSVLSSEYVKYVAR